MISIRDSNNNQDHIILDFGCETHGRSMVMSNQEAIQLAENIIEKINL